MMNELKNPVFDDSAEESTHPILPKLSQKGEKPSPV